MRSSKSGSMNQGRKGAQQIIDDEKVNDLLKQVARVRRHGFKVTDNTPHSSRSSSHEKRTTSGAADDDFHSKSRAPVFLICNSSKRNAHNPDEPKCPSKQSRSSALFRIKRKASTILSRADKQARKGECGKDKSIETHLKGFTNSSERSASSGNNPSPGRFTRSNSNNTFISREGSRQSNNSYQNLHMSVLEFQLEALVFELRNDQIPKDREECNKSPREQSRRSEINETKHVRGYRKRPPPSHICRSNSYRTFPPSSQGKPLERHVSPPPSPPRPRSKQFPTTTSHDHDNKQFYAESNVNGDSVNILKRTVVEELD